MKRLLVLVLTCVGLSAYADTYYVDANHGNDSWDGTTDYEHRDESRDIGPRKQLVEVMKLATKSGDVVYAAPGTYAEGAVKKSDSDATLNRVVVPAGVTLQSLEGAEKTFIVGAASPNTRCVALGGTGATVVGFTLTGGRTTSSASYDDGTGGAVLGGGRWSQGVGYVISDCIVSNNFASGSSPVGEGVTWVRCRILNHSATPYCYYGQFFGCSVKTTYASAKVLEQPRYCFGCTIYGSVSLRKGGDYVCTAYNSIVYNVEHVGGTDGGAIYDCLYHSMDETGQIGGNCIQVSDADAFVALGFDAEGRVSSPLVRDVGNNAFVEDLSSAPNLKLSDVPAGFDSTLDAGGGARIYNGRVDIGAWEYDIRGDIASALAAERVTVKSVTPDVCVTDFNLPVLTNGSEMVVEWTAKGAGEISYGFMAQVTGEGTLSCYKENAAEPFETVIADDGAKQVAFTSSESTVPLRFVFKGEGTATVSKFVDEAAATITDAKGGLTLTGIGPGKTVIEPGETLTFTVSRNFNTDRLCTGFILNGTDFIDFNDYPGGWEYTLDTPFSSVTIEAQYKDVQDFYVDPVNGDDSKSGFLPGEAWKTLVTISTNGNVRSGDTVYAAAGTYAEGALKKSDSDATLNRVVVPAGVTLQSLEGAEKTFIVGAASPNTRCVALGGTGATVVGFTLTGGRTTSSASYDDGTGGAVLGAGRWGQGVGYVISDCIVSNNFASGSSPVGEGVTWVRCRILNHSATPYCNYGQFFGCSVKTTYASAKVLEQPRYCYGCTIYGSVSLRTGGDYVCTAYNSIVYRVENVGGTVGGAIYDCLYCQMDETGTVGGNCVQVADANAFTALGFDAEGRVSSPLVRDVGNNAFVEDLGSAPNLKLSDVPTGFDSTLDVGGGARIYNGRVDIGAWEYDIRGDIAAALAPQRVAVTALSPNVTVSAESLPVLTNGSEMAVMWTKPSVGGGQYVFTAQVTGEGMLCCYKDGAAESFATVTEATGATRVDFTSEADTVNLRFVFAGEGSATLSRFIDQVYATVVDAKGGLVGLSVGTTVFDPTDPQTVTVTRNFNTDRLCTGFILNGSEFIDFKDYPNGWTHTFDSLESSVTIEAQYKDVQDFYVDPVNGDDSKSGFLPGEAWKTLVTISTNGNVRSGDTVYAAAGTYAEGALKKSDSDATLNRVVVPAGVTLQSLEGAEKTFIVGAAYPDTRCVALGGKDATVVGFTLTGGSAKGSGYPDGFGGAVLGAGQFDVGVGYTVADCIVSNNTAGSCAAGAGVTWVRSRLVKNGASGSYLTLIGRLYNCFVTDNEVGTLEQPRVLYACAVSSTVQLKRASTYVCAVYNSVLYRVNAVDNSCGDLHDCMYFHALPAECQTFGKTFQIMETEYRDIFNSHDAHYRMTCPLLRDAGESRWAAEIAGDFEPSLDMLRGQRIYNATADIGPCEYDMRPAFAKDLSRKLTVTVATTNVTETADGAVRLTDGQSLVAAWANPSIVPVSRTFPVKVSAGALTVKVNGEIAATFTSDGEWKYAEPVATDVLSFEFSASAADGFADLGKTIGGSGMTIFVR